MKRILKPGAKFTLIYNAKRDGWKVEDFHKFCDGQGPTICLFRSSVGNRFGGFTEVPWSNKGYYKDDKASFIFSLDERELLYTPANT